MSKFTKKSVYYHLLADVFTSIFSALVLSGMILPEEGVETNTVILITAVLSAVIYAVSVVYHYFYYKTSEYSLGETAVTCKRGVLVKRITILEYKKIHAVNKHQGLLHRIFGIGILQIDSGSTSNAKNEEITIIEDISVIDRLIAEINSKQTDKSAEASVDVIDEEKTESSDTNYKFTSKLKLIYSSISALWGMVILYLICAFAGLFLSLSHDLLTLIGSELSEIIWIILLVIAAITVLSFILSIVGTFLSYFNFKARRDGNNIVISHGLISLETHTFNINRIKAIKIKQNPLQRLFGYVSMDVEVIGYNTLDAGEENQSGNNTLIPIAKKSDVSSIIQELVGEEYIPTPPTVQPQSLFSLISWTLLFLNASFMLGGLSVLMFVYFLANTAAFSITLSLILLLMLVTNIIIVLNALLKKKSEGMYVGDKQITVVNGGISISTTVILKKHIIGIEDVTTPKRKAKGIYSFIIHIRSNDATNEVKVHCLDQSLCDALLASMHV